MNHKTFDAVAIGCMLFGAAVALVFTALLLTQY